MNNRKRISRITAIALTFVMLIASSASVVTVLAQERVNREAERASHELVQNNNLDIPTLPSTDTEFYDDELPDFEMSDLVFERYELETFQGVVNEALSNLGLSADDYTASTDVDLETVRTNLERVLNEYDYVGSLSAASYLIYTQDVTHQGATADQAYMDSLSVEVYNETLSFIQGLLSNETLSPMVTEIVGDIDVARVSNSAVYTDRQKEIVDEQTALVQEYDNTPAGDVRLGEIYLEIVALENEFAVLEPDYPDFNEINPDFGEEYEQEDLDAFYEYVKDYIAPLYVYLGMMIDFNALEEYSIPLGESLASSVQSIIGNISSELRESYDYMIDADLFQLGVEPDNMQASYTITIPYHDSAAVFVRHSNDYNDVSTLIHEFGHFNTAIRREGSSFFSMSNIDIAEVHSQSLEVLFFPYAELMYGEDALNVVRYQIFNMIWAVLSGSLVSEFEDFAHSEEDLTVEKLNAKMGELSSEYMLGLSDDWWTNVRHIYDQPFYYVSYALSAMASLSTLTVMEEDYRTAVDNYMELTTYGQSTYSFNKTLSESGYPDVFAQDTIREIANSVETYMSQPLMFSEEDFDFSQVDEDDETSSTTRGTVVPEYGTDEDGETDNTNQNNNNDESSNPYWEGNSDLGELWGSLGTVLEYIFSGALFEDIWSLR